MEAVLKFNLPEDKDEHTLALKGGDFWNCLWDLDQECRNHLKYGHKFKCSDEVLEWVRNFILDRVDINCVE